MLRKCNVFLVFLVALLSFIIPCLGHHVNQHSNIYLIRNRRQSNNCRRQFPCENNIQCVHFKKVCNGQKDCSDGSDEDPKLCNENEPVETFNCPVSKIENGQMTILGLGIGNTSVVPNYGTARISCNVGYALVPSTNIVACINGAWNEHLPKCERFCTPIESTDVLEVTCSVNTKYVNCSEPLIDGSVALSKCKNINNHFSISMCSNGFWDNPLIRCELECGKAIPDSSRRNQLVIAGERVKTGKFPWHVGIYRLQNKEYAYYCGGTIVSPLIVISVAHCFSQNGKVNPVEEYVVGAGKYYSDFMSNKDLFAQKRQVREYHIPPIFKGGASNFAGDVAVVIVKVPFETTFSVSPVCMDLDGSQLKTNTLGNVEGWRYKDPALKSFSTPYIDANQCVEEVNSDFIPYITSDKFCSSITNETEICKGYSGSGITFENGQKYYLHGVLSLSDTAGPNICSRSHGVYTNLTSYNSFIRKIVKRNPTTNKEITCQPRISNSVIINCTSNGEPVDCNKPVPDGTVAIAMCKNFYTSTEKVSISTCSKGSWNIPIIHCIPDCGEVVPDGEVYITSGENAKRGQFPWPVGIYHLKNGKYEYQCGGSIISPSLIISVAHCFQSDSDNKERYPLEEYYVAAGKYFSDFNNLEDNFSQIRQIKKINIPLSYHGYKLEYASDLSVVELNETLEMTNVVRPVCLDWLRDIDIKPHDVGVVVGWGFNDPNTNELSKELQQLNVPYIRRGECLKQVPQDFVRFITYDKFCGGYTNGSSVCKGDSGNGLFFKKNIGNRSKYFLSGVVSVGPGKGGTCDVNQYGAYTNATFYLNYIRDVIEKINGYKTQCRPIVSDFVHVRCSLNNKLIDCSQALDGTVAVSICKENFVSPTKNTSASVSRCANGFWDQPVIQCVQVKPLQTVTCSLRTSETVNVKCIENDKPVNCNKPMKEGTVAISECKDLYTPAYGDISISVSRCSKGFWNNPLISCKPLQPLKLECGELVPSGDTYAVNANTAKRGEFPWHVGLYRLIQQHHYFKCGGSIITPLIILTAAHCFTDNYGNKYPPEEFFIGAGKYYSDYNAKEDVQAQKRQVKEYHLPPTYRGYETNFQGDLAVTILLEAFEFSNVVQPVCVEWENKIEMQQLRPTNMGNVVGWGTINQYDASKASKELKQLSAPFIAVEQCLENVPPNFRRWVTADKFCAGYTNGSSVCKGDSGGGMVFEWTEGNKQKFYIRGVVSVGPTNKKKSLVCDNEKYGAYTKVSFYRRFILKIINTINGN